MAISIAELKRQRSAVKKERKSLISEMEKLITKEAPEDGDSDRFQELERCVKAHDDTLAEHDDRIEQLEAFHELAAKNADDVEDPNDDVEMGFTPQITKGYKPQTLIRYKRPTNEAKGTRFARFVIGSGIAKNTGSYLAGARYVQDSYGDEEVFKALNTTTQATGGALIPQDFRSELIELLYSQTVIRGGGARIYPMPAGNMTIPRLRGGATAQWQGELDDIADSNQALDDIQFTANKLTALVPVSNDLIRRSPLSVEAIVRDDMVRQIALGEDLAFLTSDGTSSRPTGLLTLAGSSHTNTTSPTLSVVLNELQLNELNLRGANVPMNNVKWIFHPSVRTFLATLTDSVGRPFFKEELDRGSLNGFPYMMSNQLPTNVSSTHTYVFLVAMDELIIADTLNMFADSSAEASYVDSGSTISAFARDQSVFRVIEEVDFNTRHSLAISYSEVAAWSPSGYTPGAGIAYSTQSANTDPSTAGSANPV